MDRKSPWVGCTVSFDYPARLHLTRGEPQSSCTAQFVASLAGARVHPLPIHEFVEAARRAIGSFFLEQEDKIRFIELLEKRIPGNRLEVFILSLEIEPQQPGHAFPPSAAHGSGVPAPVLGPGLDRMVIGGGFRFAHILNSLQVVMHVERLPVRLGSEARRSWGEEANAGREDEQGDGL